jgi:GAF domain-containing protein
VPDVPRTPDAPPADPARLRLARLERLQSLTEALSAAASREEVTRIVFERGLALVDASTVTLFWERQPGELELLHGIGLSEEVAASYRRVFADEHLPSVEAYRSGEPVWLASPADISARFPDLVPLAARQGVRAWAALPVGSGSSPRGAVELQFAVPRPFDGEERAFVRAVVRQCAEAVERAHLFDAHKRLAERLQQLQLTAATLAAAVNPGDVAAAAFRALGAVGACAAEIHAIEKPERLVLVARHGPDADAERQAVPLDAPEPAAEVVRTGRALWLDSADDIAGRYPRLESARAASGEGAWAVVPLLASGEALGALTVAFPSARRLESDERTFVRLVAQPCAAALERARVFAEAAQSRAAAEQAAALLSGLVGGAPAALALLDLERRFVRVNEAFARLTGVPADAHVGRRADDLLPGAAGAQIDAALREARATSRPVERDLLGETHAAPGVTIRISAVAYPVRVEGAVVALGVLVGGPR